jgi:hypothetical protein
MEYLLSAKSEKKNVGAIVFEKEVTAGEDIVSLSEKLQLALTSEGRAHQTTETSGESWMQLFSVSKVGQHSMKISG